MANESTSVADRGSSCELAERESDGLRVRLLWDAVADAVAVAVEHLRAGGGFQLAVARDRALDAFYHPFAYVGAPVVRSAS